jgi:small-conductance mechanosensitive channel
MNESSLWSISRTWIELKGDELAMIVILALLSVILIRLSTKWIVKIYNGRHTERELQKRATTLGSMIRHVAIIIVVLLASMLVLDQLGVKLGPMLATAGIVGIAVGLGAQSLVRDITNGFFLMLDDEIRVGDVVKAGGQYGTVEHISLRKTILRSIDGNVHFIPNSKIEVVTNMTKSYSFCVLNVAVAYHEDVDHVISIIRTVDVDLRNEAPYSEWILEPVDVLGLDEFAPSGMIIKARIKVQPIRQWKVKREFNRRLKKAFDACGIEIPYPHLTVCFDAEASQDSAAPGIGERIVG